MSWPISRSSQRVNGTWQAEVLAHLGAALLGCVRYSGRVGGFMCAGATCT